MSDTQLAPGSTGVVDPHKSVIDEAARSVARWLGKTSAPHRSTSRAPLRRAKRARRNERYRRPRARRASVQAGTDLSCSRKPCIRYHPELRVFPPLSANSRPPLARLAAIRFTCRTATPRNSAASAPGLLRWVVSKSLFGSSKRLALRVTIASTAARALS